MTIIEQLIFEKNYVNQKFGNEQSRDIQVKLDEAIERIQQAGKENILQDENFWKQQEIPENASIYEQLRGYICRNLEEDRGKKEFPHWTSVMGNAVTQLEDDLDTVIVFQGRMVSYQLLNDMLDQGEISLLEDGSVRRNPYRLLKKVENYQVKTYTK